MSATLEAVVPTLRLEGAEVKVERIVPPPPPLSARVDPNAQGKKLQALIGRIEEWPEARARELMRESLQAVLALHEDALARMMQLIKNAGAAGREVSEALLQDKLVRGLLLIHGLHPVSLEKRLGEALEKVRPYMKSHGGNVELIALENERARLRLQGTCKSCPSSAMTMELAVRQAVEEACPDLLGFDVEGEVEQLAATEHLPAEGPQWTVVEELDDLDEGEVRSIEVEEAPVLVLKTGEILYAYRNLCPACGTRIDEGKLKINILTCQCGHQFDVRRAGFCLDKRGIHLEPFPLLATDGTVKISVC